MLLLPTISTPSLLFDNVFFVMTLLDSVNQQPERYLVNTIQQCHNKKYIIKQQ